jgi:hypothetical protein
MRNIFHGKTLVVSKKKSIKIRGNHPNEAKYIEEFCFQKLLDSSIGSCNYKEDGINNFIAFIEDQYIQYGISINNFRNELTTVFKPSVRQLRKCESSMIFFTKKDEEIFKAYIKN